MKTKTKILLCVLIVTLLMVLGITASAADGEYTREPTVTGITAKVGSTTISNIYSDPVKYWEVAGGGSLTDYKIVYNTVGAADSVIYTALYPDTTTGRTGNVIEYACERIDGNYVVTKINSNGDGTTYIPVGGFVLSVSKSTYASFAKVGDKVTLGGSSLTIPTMAVESTRGKRIAVDATNSNRSKPMVVYYDCQFGEKTGTNQFGTEVLCQFDFEKNTFIVKSFRGFGTGDQSGSVIPENGFVLSAYGEGYRQLLARTELFDYDDELKMVGFDYVRFGGTVVGKYHYINPTKETNPGAMETETEEFPAFRGTNQTIIYKDGWNYKGATGTGTNVYGYEAAVDKDGVVVELGVNVSKIPEGGYVISGHGDGRDFVRANIVIGATVVLDEVNKTYSVSTTLNSYYENLVFGVESIISATEQRIEQLYDLDKDTINALITEAREKLVELKTVKEGIEAALEGGNITEDERLALLMSYNNNQLIIEKLRQQILVSSAESQAVSARAVWHRPVEYTYEAIEETVKMYKDIGINLIFVETLYNGYSSFYSDVQEFPYHPNLGPYYIDGDINVEGYSFYNDYLGAFVACCKEYGIEVHAWVENFYVGLQSNANVLTMHPDWVMYNDDDTVFQRNEGGKYVFIDPANKEVQDTLIKYYKDLFDKYPDIKGLNLDYIRYPVSNRDEDTGYTVAAMQGFYDYMTAKGEKGFTFTSAQLATRDKMANAFLKKFDKAYVGQAKADSNYQEWIQYRMSLVTEYVRRIKDEVKKPNDILLSTAVFASLEESYNSKKQDWKTWFANGWIDIATPMAYYNDSVDVQKRVKDMINMAGNNCVYYTGIASSYSGLPAWQNKEHIEASYIAGAQGYVVFCSTQIVGHSDVQNALISGVNSKNAILPHAPITDILKISFEDILDKADRLYIPATHMTAEQKIQLTKDFAYILALPAGNAAEIYRIQRNIDEIVDNLKTYTKNSYSRQRIKEQLQNLSALLDTRISMQLIADSEWDPEKTATRPAVAVLANPSSATLPPCEHACEICGRCGNSDSDSMYCINKCNGHNPDHVCVSVCPECQLCFNSECFEAACLNKCQGHHECESVCGECGKCTDAECEENVCADKCQGHKATEDDEDIVPDDSDKNDSNGGEEELGFFARIWKAIVDFFKRLFGIK
ncbi:MAG: hypothetical protein E7676_00960 [Ruminococcaceae bacterium]|nr:hypothetical protein [Oscillospiraceae bacterium]